MSNFRHHLAILAFGAATASVATPAWADWRVVETEHFKYYSEAPADELLETVKRMETFDTLVRALTNNQKPSSPVKVTMFEVATMDDVNHTFPYPSEGVGGYYSSTTEGPFLVTFRNTLRTGMKSARKAARQSYAWGPEVRQHEYLHHYMYQYFNANYPSWYSEGFAEYYGSMQFPEPNIVEIGHAPFFRVDTIRNGSWIDARELLTAKSYGDVNDVSALYAEGWLLTHLAAQNPERGTQLQMYLNSVASGTDYEQAAKQAFGNFDALNSDLKKHLKNINAMRLSLKPMELGDFEVRDLSPVEDKLMRYQVRLYSGYEVSDLPQIISAVQAIRTEDPDNLMGLGIQAKLQNLDGKYADALASSKRLLELDDNNVIGLTEKGKAMVGLLDSSANEAAWEEARAPLLAAIEASKTATEPRVAFFKSYLTQGILPSVAAQNYMVQAFDLLPQNDEIRYLVARDFEQRGMLDDAVAVIEPAAYGTFDGDEGKKRRRERLMKRFAEKYTNIQNYESPLEMLNRLREKQGKTIEADPEVDSE
ncbi:hypothetical protein F7D01_03085 [Erythrobacter sp. 3-20A1M]|uniref:tetratricopeptide repeat protein n=1 Tax=Erythrobacter sp. 3-20A1M TaxID=2653850 RepID=UPI001BFCD1DD|nr:hypothetical protein [Erythrobacter sp. 3-20A1M]QWC56208.1 hypothetical protein F7D01_03085 [Erythrobacter sp. 3-20A1M]